ncbi:MAG: putative multiple sugar transport system substrate-binding protein YtcQ [Paenibacillus sp.]|jgi:putative aldouronate transport system substrate-binding protein|nr:putative multiple sugar transport system substrate-binding protein YtcQ [Paenibacillus sp.]
MTRFVTGSKLIPLSTIAALAVVVTAGCGSTAETNGVKGKEAGAAQDAKPLELTMMVDNYRPTIPPADSDGLKLIQQVTGTNLNVTWVPSSNYADKLNATIASGDMPKVLGVIDPKNPGIVNAVRSNVFWEVGPYLKDYPRLSKLNPVLKNNIMMDGKLYGTPRHIDIAFYAAIYRTDWLENVGLKPPTNLDELYNVIKAFAEKDPDKNGKNDTLGLVEGENLTGFNTMLVYFGGPNNWALENNKLIPAHLTPAYMDTMKFYRKLYQEKLLNQDFPTMKQAKDLLSNQKAGIYIGDLGVFNQTLPLIQQKTPNAHMDIAPIIGKKGDLHYPNKGFSGLYMIPKSSVKTEAELKRILDYFEKLADPKIQTLMEWGIEGQHYVMENGKPKKTNEAKYQEEIDILRRLKPHTVSEAPAGIDSEATTKKKEFFKAKEDKVVGDPTMPLVSNTYSEKGKELDQIITDARVKFVIGATDEDGWKQEVEKWRQKGGDKVIEEYNAEYQKYAGKK